MRSTIRYVGLDVHREKTVIALAEKGGGAPEVVATLFKVAEITLHGSDPATSVLY